MLSDVNLRVADGIRKPFHLELLVGVVARLET
jgi:hypothetical protein